MKNKYVVSRSMNVKYVHQHLDELVANALALSRYEVSGSNPDIPTMSAKALI